MEALTMNELSVRMQGNGVDFRTKRLPDDLCPCPH
jgi:hypothetical protein